MRRISALVLSVILCFLLTCGVQAAGNEVSQLFSEVSVGEDGSARVTMNISVHFMTPATEFVVPLSSEGREITASGATYEVKKQDGISCVVFRNEAGFSGDISFVCSYLLPSAVTEGKDKIQEFSLALPEKGWNYPIGNYQLTVTFPVKIESQPDWYSAYHGVDIENYLDISVEDSTLKANSFEGFKDQETLSLTMEFKESPFDLKHQPGQTASVDTVLFWIFLVLSLAYWFFFLRGKLLRPVLRQTAVNGTTAGEIPCELSGLLPDVAGTLAHWGNLGYLTITRTSAGRIILRKKMEMGNERAAAERKLFYSIFRSSEAVDASNPRLLSVAGRIGPRVRRSWFRRLYRKNGGNPRIFRGLALLTGFMACFKTFDLMLPANAGRWFLLPLLSVLGTCLCFLIQGACLRFYRRRRKVFLTAGTVSLVVLFILSISAGTFGLMFLCLLLQIFAGLATMFGGVRLTAGNDLVRQLLGLRKFLSRGDTEELRRLAEDSSYFYEMLPVAEELGVGAAFARRCRDLPLEPCPWLLDSLSEPETSMEFYTLYAQVMASVRKEPTLSPAPKSSSKEASYYG